MIANADWNKKIFLELFASGSFVKQSNFFMELKDEFDSFSTNMSAEIVRS